MKNPNGLVIKQIDFEKISTLVANLNTSTAPLLEEELNRAEVVMDDQLPNDVVSMNSHVQFKDLDSGKESSVTLVYPQDANIEENKISVLAPIGAALIGLRVGQNIKWPLPNGTEKRLQVTAVSN